MALGQVIVRQLELADRGSVLERWLAHHLAEVMAEADRGVGPAKTAAEARAVELVLKLWAHRRALPEAADPLGGCRKAIEVLGRLAPEANPWTHFSRPHTSGGLLREMFQTLSRIVLAGLVLTHDSRARPVTAEESKGLAEEEIYLQSVFEQWKALSPLPRRRPKIEFDFVDASPSKGGETNVDSERLGDPGDQNHPTEEEAGPGDDYFHAAIVSDLEHMQKRLDELLNRWRESALRGPEAGPSAGLVGGGAATSEGVKDTPAGGDAARDEAEADKTGAESTPSERARSFWSSSSLTELAEAQGVEPVENLEGIAALWPSDDDPDELLNHLLTERAARRRAMGSPADQ